MSLETHDLPAGVPHSAASPAQAASATVDGLAGHTAPAPAPTATAATHAPAAPTSVATSVPTSMPTQTSLSSSSLAAASKQAVPPQERLQIVDEHKNFTSDLTPYLSKWDLIDKGFDYHAVAVFGSQSTGKSTLLNRLFGTSFDVMDAKRRQQTTKGIWMCPSAYSSTLVMDVEGTDGRERGDDQDFERKSALFSLASSEVLLVNLWEQTIGLYNGANMGLLKTVFEVNLNLFGGNGERPRQKTMILFVIRDYLGSTPVSSLAETLKESMDEIWASLSKPEQLANAKLEDYFDLSYAALPNKILQPEKFEEAVVDLRQRFVDTSRSDYVFRPEYHKRVPADGVPHYMEGIWEQVLANKDLDLPTQQELLAQFRCDEIAAGVLEVFALSSKAVRKPLEGGKVVSGLGKLMNEWLTTALTGFDAAASRYHNGVYSRKRQDLLASLHATLSPLYLGQLKNAHKKAMSKFLDDIAEALKAPKYDFAEAVARCTQSARDEFLETARECAVEGSGWEIEQELAQLDEDLQLIADKLRADETKKMVTAIERTVKRSLDEPIELELSKPSDLMWDHILEKYAEVLAAAEKTYLSKAKSYNCTPEENKTALKALEARSWVVFCKKLEEQTADTVLLATLRGKFEDAFRYDEHGVPRVWKPEDDLEGAYTKARDGTLQFLPLYGDIKPTEKTPKPDVPEPSEVTDVEEYEDYHPSSGRKLVSKARMGQLETRFKREADAAYVEAKRSMVSSVSQIPLWIYGALVVLGWNEAMAVLFNPLYFAMLLVLVATAYIVLQLGLAGPLLQVTRTVANEVKRIGTDKLREAFAEPPQQSGRRLEQPHRAHPINNTSSATSADEASRLAEHIELEDK